MSLIKKIPHTKTVVTAGISAALVLLAARCANDSLFNASLINWSEPFAFVSGAIYSNVTLEDTGSFKLSDTVTVVQNSTVSCIGLISNPQPRRMLKGIWNFGDSQTDPEKFDTCCIVRHVYRDTGRYKANFIIQDNIGNEKSDSVFIHVIALKNLRTVSVTLQSPANKMTNLDPLESRGVLFSWVFVKSDPLDTLTATLYLGTDSNSMTVVDSQLKVVGTTLTNLLFGTTYFWRVTAKRGADIVALSPVFVFSTQRNQILSGPRILTIRSDTTVFVNDSVPFYVSVTDSSYKITEYAWDFTSDGTFEWKSDSTAFCNYAFRDTGHFKAAFRVTDEMERSSADTVWITAIARKPEAGPKIDSIRRDTTVIVRDSLYFFAKVSDSGAQITDYAWDFDGNGTWDHHDPTTSAVVYAYANAGKFNAILQVTDKSGKIAVDTAVISVSPIKNNGNGPIVVSIRHDTTVTMFDTVQFFASVVDSNSRVTEYAWDFDKNGTFDCIKKIANDTCKKVFDSAGYFPTLFRATDSLGKIVYDTVRITVKKTSVALRFISSDTVVDSGATVRCSVVVANTAISPIFEIDAMNSGKYVPMKTTGLIGTYAFKADTSSYLDSVKVRVYSSFSDTVHGGFKLGVRPRPLAITSIDSTDSSITVQWTKTTTNNFQEYLIFRHASQNVDTNSNLWATISQASTISRSAVTYNFLPRYYRIYQRDKYGLLSAGSNVVFGNIKNSAPTRPSFVIPGHAGDTVPSNGVLRWHPGFDKNSDTITYELLFNKTGSQFVSYKKGITDTFFNLINLDTSSFHAAVRLVARDPHGAGDSVTVANIYFRKASGYGMYMIPHGTFVDSSGNHATITYDYLMDSVEVTQLSYKTFMSGANPSPIAYVDDKSPVENVTFYQAIMYCNARSKARNWDTAYSFASISATNAMFIACNLNVQAFRLPTEDEWEMAAKGGNQLKFATDDGSISCGKAAYGSCGLTKPVNAGSYAPNPFGIKDLTGNVGEWCWDNFISPRAVGFGQPSIDGRQDYSYVVTYGPGGQTRVQRGGDFLETNQGLLSTESRRGVSAATAASRTGFRCVVPQK